MPGTLVVCATPIGNLDDVSPRLVAALRDADVVFAEDTRRTGTLLSHIGVTTPMRSFFAGNERSRLEELESLLRDGRVVALVSDAGTPGVSDPGASAVRCAAGAGADVAVVPGPSAVTAAISVSGFDGDRFVFEGFLPRKGEARKRAIARISGEQRTTVMFAAPSRVDRDLGDLAEVCGSERSVVVTRELSKIHEELWRGSLGEAADTFTGGRARGEFVIVIEGSPPPTPDLGAAMGTVERLTEAGLSTSDAVREASSAHGVSRRELYDLAIRSRS